MAACEVVRAARRAVRGVEDGRARASIVSERVVAIVMLGGGAVARSKVDSGCGNSIGRCSDWLQS